MHEEQPMIILASGTLHLRPCTWHSAVSLARWIMSLKIHIFSWPEAVRSGLTTLSIHCLTPNLLSQAKNLIKLEVWIGIRDCLHHEMGTL